MELYVGTSGFSYKEWKGPFYPEKIKPADMLAYYAGKLPAVEINNTFYRMPRKDVMEGWAAKVPDSFRFSIKASRRITHFKRLKPESESELGYLSEAIGLLGKKLGVVLFQLPPNFKADLERLKHFLKLVPEAMPAAFEFRNVSWFEQPVYDALSAAGCALCVSDKGEGTEAPVVPTANWGYARLRRPDYTDEDLYAWAGRFRDAGWRHAYVFFKHEDEAAGPHMADRFRTICAEVCA